MSHRPSRPSSPKRFRQRITVFRFIESAFAIVTSESPAAAAKTIRHRKATCCGVPCAAVHCWSFSRSISESGHDFPMPKDTAHLAALSSYLLDTTLARVATRLHQTRSVSISIPPLLIAPISPRTRSGSDFVPGVESVLYHRPRASSETPSRTSCRDHAMGTAAAPEIPRSRRSRCAPSAASKPGGMPGDSGQADTPTLQVNEEQDVVCHQPTPGEHFDREEIDAGQHRHMRLNKFLPDEMRRSIPEDATLWVIKRIHSVQLEIRRSTLEKE